MPWPINIQGDTRDGSASSVAEVARLRALQRGESWDEIRQDWPTVPEEAIQEALALAIEKLVDSYEFEDEFEYELREAV